MNMQAKLKFLVLSMALATAMMLPMNVNAQRSDNFIMNADEGNDSFRSAEWAFVISNNSFGAPLGSGLVILSVAGVGYAVVRRKRASRKCITLLLALTLCLGLTQCRKNIETISNLTTNTVRINLDIDGGSRVNVTPGASVATVSFTKGDTIFVAYDGKYVGKLGHNGSTFSGEITAVQNGEQRLYFYFFGNAPHTALKAGETESCSAVISDQASSLPVVSFAASNEPFYGAGSYSAALDNKCALVKFNVKDEYGTAINTSLGVYITGINDKVNVNFSIPTGDDNGFTYSQNNDNGSIMFEKRDDGNYWAIMLPETAWELGADGTVFSGRWKGVRPALAGDIAANDYNTTGIDLVVEDYQPEGALSGLFSVGVNKKVRFSKGNLQYQASTKTWQFADNQKDIIGNAAGNTTSSGRDTQAAWIDLFGWGTSGYNHGAICYQPYETSTTNNNYRPYGGTYNLYDKTGKADWGYNKISNGKNVENQWRTLTKDEWTWLLGPYQYNEVLNPGVNCRTASTVCGVDNALYAKVTVGNSWYDASKFYGIVIFPDEYTQPAGVTLNHINYYEPSISYDKSWGSAQYQSYCDLISETQLTAMLENGAVFLPVAGRRDNVTFKSNTSGYYASSTWWNTTNNYALVIGYGNYVTANTGSPYSGMSEGNSVRLICE